MERNVYLLVTDIHLALSKDNRFNYFSEVTYVLEQIHTINNKYKSMGYRTNIITLGDIFDSSSNVPEESMLLLELYKYFISKFDGVYSVIGNHEITYQKDNPFWYMISEIEDDRMSKVSRVIQPRGLQNYIKIPAVLEDGDTVFYFNHYGTSPKVADKGNVRIGLFHQDIGSENLTKMWGTYDDVEKVSYIQSYNYCFFGHLHLAKGKYWLNEQKTCKGEWLGSIGRTNVLEVNDNDLKVNIPAIIIENSVFKSIEDNYVIQRTYNECVDDIAYKATKKAREVLKERKQKAEQEYLGSSLLNALEIKLENTDVKELFDLCKGSSDRVISEYKRARDFEIFEDNNNEDENEDNSCILNDCENDLDTFEIEDERKQLSSLYDIINS